jgi:DNA-binding NtrC family response regulator
VKRVGSNHYAKTDVRLIAASNKSLRNQVKKAKFRSDLYYRLAVVHVRIPPLRERRDDLPQLIQDILSNMGLKEQLGPESIRALESIESLGEYPWPGNVRQLRNYLEQRIALGSSAPPPIKPGHDSLMPPPSMGPSSIPSKPQKAPDKVMRIDIAYEKPLKEAREAWNSALEARYLEELLLRNDDNVSAAARAAGVNRVHLYRLLWKYGLRETETVTKT